MEPADLKFQTVRRLHLQSPDAEGIPNLSIFGLAGADAFVVGISVSGITLSRRPPRGFGGLAETVPQLKIRASKEVPKLNIELRDSNQCAVAWLIYRGLRADHCKPF